MALTITHNNSGQGAYRCVVEFLDAVSGTGNSDPFKCADFLGHVFHVLRNNAATGTVNIQSSIDGVTWIIVQSINIGNGSTEYCIDQRSYPYLRINYANIAAGTLTVRSAHYGGI